MNKQAKALNSTLGDAVAFLSSRGKRMYFPYGGILGQSAEARACKVNATIGMAFEEDGSPLPQRDKSQFKEFPLCRVFRLASAPQGMEGYGA